MERGALPLGGQSVLKSSYMRDDPQNWGNHLFEVYAEVRSGWLTIESSLTTLVV